MRCIGYSLIFLYTISYTSITFRVVKSRWSSKPFFQGGIDFEPPPKKLGKKGMVSGPMFLFIGWTSIDIQCHKIGPKSQKFSQNSKSHTQSLR